MDATPCEPAALHETLDETDDVIVAELNDEFGGDGPATIPFRLPAPPNPGWAVALVAGLVIATFSFAAGWCISTVLHGISGDVIFFAVLGFFFFTATAWTQLLGVFRPHDERAHFAGNVLVGAAAMVAAALSGIPLISAQPLLWSDLLGHGGLSVFLAIAGYLNLLWSRWLRSVGWRSVGDWAFSLRELLAIFTAIAVGCGGYMLCTRMHEQTARHRQQMHEIWRQMRITDAQLKRQAAPPPASLPPTTAGTAE